MKYIIYSAAFATCFFLFSCKKEIVTKQKETEIKIIPNQPEYNVNLSISKVINDSTITVKWDKFRGENFAGYIVSQSKQSIVNNNISYNYIEHKISDIDSTEYTISDISPFPNALINVRAAYNNGSQLQYVYDDINYTRPDAYILNGVTDALIDQSTKILFIIDRSSGVIISHNYQTNKNGKKLSLETGVGHAAIGSFNGRKELYIPRRDGWVDIIDCNSLTVSDRIYAGGSEITSVATANGQLVVASSDMSANEDFTYRNTTKIYDRSSKTLLNRTGYSVNTSLIYLDNSQSEFVDITYNRFPVQMSYLKIDKSGDIQQRFASYSNYSLNPDILRSFPDGKKFITAGNGTIYKSNLAYESVVNRFYDTVNGYSDFAFNSDGSIIYCAVRRNNEIIATSYPGNTQIKSYKTALYPIKIFRDGNQLICVTTDGASDYNGTIIIQKINL